MEFKLLPKVQAITEQDPLPDDAWQQLEAIADQAKGMEQTFINMCFEALIAAATPEQLALWNPPATDEEIAQWDAELAAKGKQ
ncbi:hypothetical protein Q4519_14800 [Motilimonas sp. 1_MG-2023]|uniref:hypothetical protein n=1 Tax=Motilimonas sp. 1_MG-2023 TaxID=3062672 RepID=UPI0026E35588|nr:hypothetical protein [Motilimonas sp. 1_MG-2023]MDO6526953.1 hypothetical protein [Motilimonas sp. 1_MG-2023]